MGWVNMPYHRGKGGQGEHAIGGKARKLVGC